MVLTGDDDTDKHINIGRQKSVIFEKYTPLNNHQLNHSNRNFQFPLFFDLELLRKDKFEIELYINNQKFENIEILGFSMSEFKTTGKTLKIKTAVYSDRWIDGVENINIIKLFILDSYGNNSKTFDFDVILQGYKFDCDYSDDALFSPYFVYKILE